MTLADLIARLESADPSQVVRHGFTHPHSYRGDYMDLAFEPATDVPVAAMLAAARSALNATFQGYKGGEFTMGEHTWCWLSAEGDASGETISALLLDLMLAPAVPAGQAPATDRAALREAIRRAVCEAEGFAWDSDMLEPDEYGDHADAVLAALPASVDRADVLREEAARIRAHCPDHLDADSAEGSWTDCHCAVADDMRKRANELRTAAKSDRDRVVAYRSPAGTALYCTRHYDELGPLWPPVLSEDLPDGGLCTKCGADVLIPQQPKKVRP